MPGDATKIEEHLRAASDAILLLLTEVGQLERHKRGIPPGEPRFDEVARSVRVAAQALAEFTEWEETWARIATDGRTDIEPISRSEAAPRTADILERWRAVERQLDDLEPGSPESARLFAEFERLRDEYLAVFRDREGRDPTRISHPGRSRRCALLDPTVPDWTVLFRTCSDTDKGARTRS